MSRAGSNMTSIIHCSRDLFLRALWLLQHVQRRVKISMRKYMVQVLSVLHGEGTG